MMFRRKNRQNEIQIQLEDVEIIMGKDYARLPFFLSTVFCETCSGQTKIDDYTIFVDDTNDLIFDGKCVMCNTSVARYIETGESKSTAEAARHIRHIKTTFPVRESN